MTEEELGAEVQGSHTVLQSETMVILSTTGEEPNTDRIVDCKGYIQDASEENKEFIRSSI